MNLVVSISADRAAEGEEKTSYTKMWRWDESPCTDISVHLRLSLVN